MTSALRLGEGRAGHIQGDWEPMDSNAIGWTFDPVMCSGGSAGTSASVYLCAIPIRKPSTVTNIIVGVSSAGATLTSARNFAGLYQGSTRLAITADQSTVWNSTGMKTMALATPQTVTPGMVYVGLLATGTTPPSFYRSVSEVANSSINSSFQRPWRFGVAATSQTSLPSTASITGTGPMWWIGLT